jgi:hypothetical protein
MTPENLTDEGASGVPEAEPVAWRYRAPEWPANSWAFTTQKGAWIGGDTIVEPLFAAPPPVAAPSGEAIAQAYRAGFKAGKVWAEPTPVAAPSVESQETLSPGNQHEDK